MYIKFLGNDFYFKFFFLDYRILRFVIFFLRVKGVGGFGMF